MHQATSSDLNIVSLNLTTAIPKRVRLICSVLENYGDLKIIGWERSIDHTADDVVTISASNLFTFLRRLFFKIRSGNFNVVIFDDIRLIPLLILINIRKRYRIIYNRQEVPTSTMSMMLRSRLPIPKWLADKLANQFENLIVRHICGVITIPVKKQQCSRLASWNRPIFEVSNLPNIDSLPKLSSKPITPITFIYSGAMRNETGLNLYLSLIRTIADRNPEKCFKLILVGHYWGSSKIAIDSMVAGGNDANLVETYEWVPYDELENLYKKSHIALAFADPMHEKYKEMKSGSSRKIFTYMAAGLPILAAGAFSEIVSKESIGVQVEYGDVEEMVFGAEKLVNNLKSAHSMGMTGRKLIEEKYYWENVSPELVEFFDTCLK